MPEMALVVEIDRLRQKIEKAAGIVAAAHNELDYWRIPRADPDTNQPLTLAGRIALGMAQGGAYGPQAGDVRPAEV